MILIQHSISGQPSSMGKGSNVSKAQRARADAAKRAQQEGKGGGGKAGMMARKDGNVADKIAAAQAEREKIRKAREEKKLKQQKEAEAVNKKIQRMTQSGKSSKGKKKKNDLSLLDGY